MINCRASSRHWCWLVLLYLTGTTTVLSTEYSSYMYPESSQSNQGSSTSYSSQNQGPSTSYSSPQLSNPESSHMDQESSILSYSTQESSLSYSYYNDPCDSDPCQNNGECILLSGGDWECDCLDGWIGRECDMLDNPCNPNPCRNGGTCIPPSLTDTGEPECNCKNSWEGPTCEIEIDPCEDFCENGGTCYIDNSGQRDCHCIVGWKGRRCDVEDPCVSDPCYNGGSCRSGSSNSFICDCTTGYTGEQCETDPCDPDPCDRGECHYRRQATSGYVCDCEPGYNQTNCDNDIAKPRITCPPSKSFQLNAGQSSRVVTWPTPDTYDNSGDEVIVTCVPPSGTTFYEGEREVVCEAVDESGNTKTCRFEVVISDQPVPQINCIGDITIPASNGVSYATVTYPAPGLVNADSHACSPISGANFEIGETRVTCEAWKDAVKASCIFFIFVEDNQDPVIDCPADITMATAYGEKHNEVWWTAPVVSDNSRMYSYECDPSSGDTFYMGEEDVWCTARDEYGNDASCKFFVTIEDREIPTVTCPPLQTSSADWRSDTRNVWYGVDWDDNSDEEVIIECDPSDITFPIGSTRVRCVGTDTSGNTNDCSFDVVITDDEPPVIICPLDISVTRTNGAGGATVQWAIVDVYDNSGIEPSTECNPNQNHVFQFGKTTVTCNARDVAGNSESCQFYVEVTDFDIPTVTCPADIVVSTDPGKSSTTVTWDLPSSDEGVIVECYPPPGESFEVQYDRHRVKCYATSEDWVSSVCDFFIEVQDLEDPVIQCPSNQVAVSPGWAVVPTYSEKPSYIDNSGVTWLEVSCEPSLYDALDVGLWDVTCSVEDLSGNEAQCSFSVQVVTSGTDVCDSEPCGENGECVSSASGFTCQCFDGWSGSTCQIEDDTGPDPDDPDDNPDDPDGDGDDNTIAQTSGNTGTIIGAVVGVFVLIVVLVAVVACFLMRRRRPKRALPMSKHNGRHPQQKHSNGNIPLTSKSKSPAKSVSGNSVFDNPSYKSDKRYVQPTAPSLNVEGQYPASETPSTTYGPPSPHITGSKPPSSPRINSKVNPSPRPQSAGAALNPQYQSTLGAPSTTYGPPNPHMTGSKPPSSPRFNSKAPPNPRPQSTPGSRPKPPSSPRPTSKPPSSPRHKAESRPRSAADPRQNHPQNKGLTTKNANHRGRKIPPRLPSMPASAMYGRGAVGGANSPYGAYLNPMPSAHGSDLSQHVYEEIKEDGAPRRAGHSNYAEAYSEVGKQDSGYMEVY